MITVWALSSVMMTMSMIFVFLC